MASPIPIPAGLVVKNASKICSAFFRVDPDAGIFHSDPNSLCIGR